MSSEMARFIDGSQLFRVVKMKEDHKELHIGRMGIKMAGAVKCKSNAHEGKM